MKIIALITFLSILMALGLAGEARAQTCPDGYPIYCGNNLCCPSGYSCGGSCGANCCGQSGPGGTCPAGYPVDCNNGYCCPSGYACNGSTCSAVSGPGNGPDTGGGQIICESVDVPGCSSVQACAGDSSSGQNSPQAYYDADGRTFYCDAWSCESAAQDVVDYCDSKMGGCSVANAGVPKSSGGGYWLLAISAALALAFVARRRRAVGIAALCLTVTAAGAAVSACGPTESDAEAARDEVAFKANMAVEAIVETNKASGVVVDVAHVETPADVIPARATGDQGAPALR